MRATSSSPRLALVIAALAAGVGAWAGLASITAAAPVEASSPAGASAVASTPSPLIYPSETIPMNTPASAANTAV